MLRFLAGLCFAVLLLASCASTDSATDSATAAAADADAPQATADSAESTQTDAASPSDTEPEPEAVAADEPAPNPPGEQVNACAAAPDATRVDLSPTGNRIAPTFASDLSTAQIVEFQLPDTAEWVLADPTAPGGWHVRLANGTALKVSSTGAVTETSVGPEEPPLLNVDGGPTSSAPDRARFDNPLPDTRVVFGRTGSDNPGEFSLEAALVTPTDRYRHGVLGDAVEAAAISVRNRCDNTSIVIEVDDFDAIEGVSPMFGDVDGDGADEVLVTVSNTDGGARLVMYEADGTFIAESEPIGRANRWRNQLAIAPVGPNGEVEVIDVRTPHIGGTVQFFRLSSGALERVAASEARFTTHAIGSRNLDLGFVGNADGDPELEVVVLTSDRRSVVVLERTDDGVAVTAELTFESSITTNLAPAENGELGLGLSDGRLIALRPA